MSDPTLSYATPVNRPSPAGTISIWFAALGDALFILAMLAHKFVAKPDLLAGLNSYHWKKMWFTVVPAWTGIALAFAAACFAFTGLPLPGCSRARAAVGLGLAMILPALMFSPLSLG